ncbi:SRPBCC family protein [Mesorhizobium sp. ES1-6]|uniref:SRPBCC family protein n=1 Tax=Mesorhizobium sp. ES1-6 TaxID=2876626 RepID=UPI001CCA96F3|nr:SRPBCC domain-containing protein [Mesorhizobium sp. ES1-6]
MPLAVEHRTFIRSTPEDLYARLTSGSGWEGWFATEASIGDKIGSPVYFRWQNFGADRYSAEDYGHVATLDDGRSFAFTWHPGSTETLVSFTFEQFGNGCMLIVKETGYSGAERDIATALSVASGWGEALTLFKFFVEHNLLYGPVPSDRKWHV